MEQNENKVPTNIPEDMMKYLLFVSEILKGQTNNWLDVKNYLLRISNSSCRGLLSKSHPSTFKQLPNDLEWLLIKEWKTITGEELYLRNEDIHDPAWEKKGRGWHLRANRGKDCFSVYGANQFIDWERKEIPKPVSHKSKEYQKRMEEKRKQKNK